MASDSIDKLSIKQLLFTKAMPNYVIPENTAGYKTYPCIDCGDRFIFQSSYDYHVNRKSVLITYMCRHCNQLKTFHNRCKLLSHIRSHTFKTATINVSDLKVEPLPASYFDSLAAKHASLQNSNKEKTVVNPETPKNPQPPKPKKIGKFSCTECKKEVPAASPQIYKDRAKHFMQYTNQVHACPVCLFALPTTCGLKVHLRLHTNSPPYYCPECGICLSKKAIQYPYTHDCEGFRMMRATARYRCPIQGCYIFHPNDYKAHMKNNHLKKVFKCPMCVVACFNETTIRKHLASHQVEGVKAVIFFQCEMCPGRLVLQTQMDNHMRGHITNSAIVYPCWACGQVFRDVRALLKHHSTTHSESKKITDQDSVPSQTPEEPGKETNKSSITYRVVKRCDKCKRSFTYKCKYEQIAILPNECPFKCAASKESPSRLSQITTEESGETEVRESPDDATIKCHLCKKDVSENWKEIKKHYANDHKSVKFLDAQLVLDRIDAKKYNRKVRRAAQRRLQRALKKHRGHKVSQLTTSHPPITEIDASPSVSSYPDNPLACKKCGHQTDSKDMLEEHLMSHRDPGMAYQCMECGQCFAVKPSFTTHLLIQHGISDVDEYVNIKQCYNADALLKNNFTIEKCEVEEPLLENQCQICRDQFDNIEDLEKHFRVHGMAFLMKNSSNKTSP